MNIKKPIYLSLFRSHVDTMPQGTEMSVEEAGAFFGASHGKQGVVPSFSMNRYLPGGRRRRENVQSMTGMVFDLDVKGQDCPVLSPMVSREIEESVQSLMETHGVMGFWYRTKSWQEHQPCLRIVLPSQEDIPVRDWPQKVQETFWWLQNHWGERVSRFLDLKATLDVSKVWLLQA